MRKSCTRWKNYEPSFYLKNHNYEASFYESNKTMRQVFMKLNRIDSTTICLWVGNKKRTSFCRQFFKAMQRFQCNWLKFTTKISASISQTKALNEIK